MYLQTSSQGLGRWHPGLGDAATAAKNVQAAGAIGSGVATAAVGMIASHLAATGGSLIGLSSATLSAAVPFIGPALMAATLVIQMLVANSGCGQTCIETSQWADQAAQALQQVLDGYFALPAPRTQTQQALAVAAFNDIWRTLQQQCGSTGTGNAGVRCISDRQAGACTWKQKYAPVYPGEPAIGECWNWFNGYLGPIQADPVVPDASVQTSVSSAGSDLVASLESATGGSSLLPLLLVGGLVAWGLMS